jgi:hypothetical protein
MLSLAGSGWHILPTAALCGLAAARGCTVLCSCSMESLLMQRQSRVLRLCAIPFTTKAEQGVAALRYSIHHQDPRVVLVWCNRYYVAT